MNICQNCKAENDANSSLCKNCGSEIVSEKNEMELIYESDIVSEGAGNDSSSRNLANKTIKRKVKKFKFFRSKKNVVTTVVILVLIIGIGVVWKTGVVFNAIANGLYNDLYTSKITYEEAQDKLNILKKFGDVSWIYDKCDKLNNSRTSYNKAVEYKNKNKPLLAIAEYKKVIPDDPNYEDAKTEIKAYLDMYTEKYNTYIETEDYSSALIMALSGFVNVTSDEKNALIEKIRFSLPTKLYWSMNSSGEQILFPYSMNEDEYYILEESKGGIMSIVSGWQFNEKHRLIPSCFKYGDDTFIFLLYVDDSDITNIYRKDENGNYTVSLYDRNTNASLMFDSTIYNSYTTKGIANMIFDYVLEDEPLSFKTNDDKIFKISREDSKVWLDVFAYNYICNEDKNMFDLVYKKVHNNPFLN